ncbi:terpene synthase family protein [Streptomyces aidingensis]|nr:terpene synthase family protein [Streptomyces aidingensis]
MQTATELERLRRMEGGKLAACVYPHGLYDQLLWETKLNVFLFSFDDAYCDIGEASRKPGELARVTNQLTYVLETPAAAAFHAEPFAVAVRELRRELDGFATPTQVTRWVHTFSAYLHRQTLHAAYREREEFPPFDDFFAARLDTSGSKSLGSQGDIIEGFEVPLGEWRHPEVQAVVDACGATVAITNDLFSYNEERQEKREWVHNLVELFAAYYRCSRQDAALKTVVEYEKVIRAYLALRERIQRWGSPELNRYVDLCGHWPRANHDWAITSARYNQVRTPGFPVEPAAESLWATQRLERSQLSPIQWWWDLLEGE